MGLEADAGMKKMAVLYHYPCHDGVFAALAAYLYSSAVSAPALFFPNTVYSPITIDQLPLQDINHVYLLDFVGPPGFASQISSKVEGVTILDHHKTAVQLLGGSRQLGENVTKVLDMNRSGATIAFDYFKQKLADQSFCASKTLNQFERMQQVFKYVEDADLWRWSLPGSRAFHAGLTDENIEYNAELNPFVFHKLLSLDIEAIINEGKRSLSQKQKLINDALNRSFEISIGNGLFGRCLAVEADAIQELRSELGHQLAGKSQSLELRGIGAVVYRVAALGNNGMLKISLRSLEGEDTTEISKKFGGGGHENASSFMLSCNDFSAWRVQEKS